MTRQGDCELAHPSRDDIPLPTVKHLYLPIFLLTPFLHGQTSMTIYNQNVAVIREVLPIDLQTGLSTVTFDKATSQVKPDSVVLRDPTGQATFTILEQGYRNDPVSEGLLLQMNEGKTIPFLKTSDQGETRRLQGKIIRSGYRRRNQNPLIEVNGELRFGLPGLPVFPSLGDNNILRPTLSWQLDSPTAQSLDAQLSYLSGGFSWEATYNVVAPENDGPVQLSGWVTLSNRSGADFPNTKIKLVAGELNMISEERESSDADPFGGQIRRKAVAAAPVTQKAFDDFHLYSLPRPLSLKDQETKQVEFLRSEKVQVKRSYYYSGIEQWNRDNFYLARDTSETQKEITTSWIFENSETNGLGMPLPAGKIRFYRSDGQDNNLEFVGGNRITHTPKKETVTVETGTAFDLLGDRKVTQFSSSRKKGFVKETIEVTLTNRSEKSVEITVGEPLWRWTNWKIEDNSHPFTKVNSRFIEFTVPVAADSTQVITFTTHYSGEPESE